MASRSARYRGAGVALAVGDGRRCRSDARHRASGRMRISTRWSPRVKRRGVVSPRCPAEQSTATATTRWRMGLSMYTRVPVAPRGADHWIARTDCSCEACSGDAALSPIAIGPRADAAVLPSTTRTWSSLRKAMLVGPPYPRARAAATIPGAVRLVQSIFPSGVTVTTPPPSRTWDSRSAARQSSQIRSPAATGACRCIGGAQSARNSPASIACVSSCPTGLVPQ